MLFCVAGLLWKILNRFPLPWMWAARLCIILYIYIYYMQHTKSEGGGESQLGPV